MPADTFLPKDGTAITARAPFGEPDSTSEQRARKWSTRDHDTAPVEEDDPSVRKHIELVETIRTANSKARDGRPDLAVLDYQRLLEQHPSQSGIWFALAGAWSELGEADKAIACLEQAVALRPAFALYLRHLGEAYRGAGRLRDAVDALSKAARIDPRHSACLLYLALASFQLGDMAQGKAWLAKSVEATAKHLKTHVMSRARSALLVILFAATEALGRDGRSLAFRVTRRLGSFHLKRGRFAAAEERFRATLQQVPDDFESLLGLGRSLLEKGQTLEALASLRKAAAKRPHNAQALAELGTACFRQGEIDGAFECLQRALKLDADAPRANRFMGWTLLRLEKPETAMDHFKRCLEAEPDCADAAFGISQALQNLGRFEESSNWLQRTLEIEPNHAGSLLTSVKNDKTRRNATTLAGIRKTLEKEGISTETRIRAHFAAGMIEDHLGNIDRAFEHYEAANSLKDVTCDIGALSDLADRMMAIFTKEFFRDRQNFGVPDRRPIFIVGMPRSGSTLVEQILASHPDVAGGGELYHFPKHLRAFRRRCPPEAPNPGYLMLLDERETRSIAEGYLADLHGICSESPRITDKMLFNFWNLGVIALALPNAKIIHTMRDPLDCCTSIYLRDFTGVHIYAYNQTKLGSYYRIYQRLMDHWRTALPVPMLDVQYEDVVAKPLDTMRRIVAHCDLEWHDCCQEFYKTQRPVSTSSYAQVRQPIYGTAVGRWQRYDGHLDALKAALAVGSQ